MMTKHKTPRRFAWIYLLALPLAGALILGFSARAEVPAAEGAAPEQVVAEQTPANDPIPSISPLDKEKIKTTRFNLQLASRDSTRRERPYFDRTLLSDFNFRNFPSGVEVKECSWSFNTLPGNVYATAAGTVAETGRDTDEGYFILIRHGEGYTTRYGRLEKIRVEAGDAVQRGQVIGEMQNDLSYRVHNNNASDATIVYAHASLSFQSPEPGVARDSAVVIKFRSGESFSFVFPIKEKDGERVAVSGFGQRRGIPHTGIDIAVSQGTEVVAAAPGRVAESKYDDGRGNYIVIRHNDEYSTLYAHLEKASVKSGDTVEKGQIIGTVGSTGLSTGPHLHYEIHKNGTPVDPGDWGN